MNFFDHQADARRQTRRMLVLFSLAVGAIVLAVDLVVLIALGLGRDGAHGIPLRGLLLTSLVVVVVIGACTLYRVSSLRGGGGAVARQLGAMPVPADTVDPGLRRLCNVVEEIAIASAVLLPEIYVLESEGAINAFASGYAPADAAVTVTRGCLDHLTREELQGVIAHEFSHVLNGDMRLNTRLIGVAFGILAISVIGRKLAELSARSRMIGGVIFVGFTLMAVGSLGVLFARMIKASISRQREFLADASAVQFTRQTEGIAGALKKIGAMKVGAMRVGAVSSAMKIGTTKIGSAGDGSRLRVANGEEVAHMLFGDGIGYSSPWFATHPPVLERIRRLEPGFREQEFARIAVAMAAQVVPARLDVPAAAASDAAGAVWLGGAALPAAQARVAISAGEVAAHVGCVRSTDLEVAVRVQASLPPPLVEAARDRARAIPLVLALVFDPADRARQRDLVRAALGEAATLEVERLTDAMADLHPMQRLPLATLAFPALRRQPRPQLTAFVGLLDRLIAADGRVSLHEYCLARLVSVQVVEALNPGGFRRIGRVKLSNSVTELHDLFAVFADHGHDDEPAARRAFLLGMHEVLPGVRATYAPPADWAAALDRALARLGLLAPAGKELLIRGLTLAIGADGAIRVAEAELLRTVCASLNCPLPSLVPQPAH